MEQPANGLSATSAYDLACRYNSLFQYSPAAAAACAAAYGMFGSGSGSKNGPIGSSSSPFQPLGAIATSSLPSSSSSNLTSSPTSSLSSLVSNHSKQEPLPPPPPSTHKPVVQPPLDKSDELAADECDAKSKTHNNSYENVSDNGSERTDTNSDDEAEHNLSSLSECVEEEEEDDKGQLVDVDVQAFQQKLNTEAEKSIAACVDQVQASLDEDKPLEQLDDENKKSSSACSLLEEQQQCSIGSLMHTLSVKQERACQFKLSSIEFDALRKSLVDSVTQAIESTLDTFSKRDTKQHTPNNNNTTSTGNSNSNTNSANCNKQDKHKLDPRAYQTQSAPKRIRVNEKIGKMNSLNNNSQNFNVSKILSKEGTGHAGNSTSYMNGINNAHINMNTNKRKLSESFAAGFGSSSLLQTKAGLASPAQSLLSTNLTNQKQHFAPFYSAMSGVPYGSGGAFPAMGSGASTPSAGSTHSTAASTNGSITSLFAAHQHQLLMAAAQAAAASGQNANYLHMAAAANRLFTPYLMDQHTSHSAKPNAPSSSASSAIFHSPHKRRRTKVTDTRLSPRNPLLRAKTRDESPTNDDHEHDNDYDDEHPHNHHHQHNNQEDDSASSGCNESASTTGSNSRLANTYHSNNIYDIGTETTDYTGYQTSTLSSLHLRKAKLMFFFSRYPSSTILRNFFPDVKFNKANTAQLVKWFSNFREFFYIQMEKFARQHLAEGMRNADDILVDCESEIFRALNSHYNRNNQLEIPASFCFVIQATLREFFKAIQEGKDMDPSWKKAIYKIIARMDDQIPEYFKSVQWMESLETNI